MERAPARFQPVRPATRSQRILLLGIGPVLWLVALIGLAVLLQRLDAIESALIVLAGCFVVAVVWLLLSRARRVREERAR